MDDVFDRRAILIEGQSRVGRRPWDKADTPELAQDVFVMQGGIKDDQPEHRQQPYRERNRREVGPAALPRASPPASKQWLKQPGYEVMRHFPFLGRAMQPPDQSVVRQRSQTAPSDQRRETDLFS